MCITNVVAWINSKVSQYFPRQNETLKTGDFFKPSFSGSKDTDKGSVEQRDHYQSLIRAIKKRIENQKNLKWFFTIHLCCVSMEPI